MTPKEAVTVVNLMRDLLARSITPDEFIKIIYDMQD